ncbi:uncharacterized protein LOC122645167 [Telopea speciosissima]|uniref:uncharacterized protein LOC122645167 n=1 Tax=Telopea speciosissima TaxID=54955 RepID=UPI001CC3E7CD|nr:uncharacterized protein LOC122645167 [Telopea speciosissima]
MTWKTPKMKSFATTANPTEAGRPKPKLKALKSEYVPVYVVLGLIGMSMSLGVYTVTHQLKHSPNVLVSKKKRGTLPELEDPDNVVEESDKFHKKSFFRKVDHIQESDHRKQSVPDPTWGEKFVQ